MRAKTISHKGWLVCLGKDVVIRVELTCTPSHQIAKLLILKLNGHEKSYFGKQQFLPTWFLSVSRKKTRSFVNIFLKFCKLNLFFLIVRCKLNFVLVTFQAIGTQLPHILIWCLILASKMKSHYPNGMENGEYHLYRNSKLFCLTFPSIMMF